MLSDRAARVQKIALVGESGDNLQLALPCKELFGGGGQCHGHRAANPGPASELIELLASPTF